MSEYEIFNGDEEIEPVAEKKKALPPKKEKVEVKAEKTENKDNAFVDFLKSAFSMKGLPITLSCFSLLFTLFVGFFQFVVINSAPVVAAFFFLGFGVALAGLVIECVNMYKDKKFEFSIRFVLVVLALVLSCLALPMAMTIVGGGLYY